MQVKYFKMHQVPRVIRSQNSLSNHVSKICQAGYRGSMCSYLVVLWAPGFKHSGQNNEEGSWHLVASGSSNWAASNPLHPGFCPGWYRKLENAVWQCLLGHRPITLEVVLSSKKNTHWLSLQGNHFCPLTCLRQIGIQSVFRVRHSDDII